jgi:diketogulonate reductase-like aldo/keto reductase
VKKSGLKRSEFWITSKVAPGKVSTYDACLDAIDGILDELDMTYLDLLLIHTPKLGKAPTIELWKCLIEAKRIGKTKSIGVSNFNQGEIEDITKATGQMPAANEIQIHPWSSPSWKALTKWQKENNIATIAYTSLGGSRFDSTKSSSTWPYEVSKLAKKYDATEAQILLKWALQNGVVVIPGSGSKKHIKENLLLEADFVMTDEELLSIENSSVPKGWWDPKRGHSKYTDEEARLPWAKRKNG